MNTLQYWCCPCSGKILAQSCFGPRNASIPCPDHIDYDKIVILTPWQLSQSCIIINSHAPHNTLILLHTHHQLHDHDLPCLTPWWRPWQAERVKAQASALWTSTWCWEKAKINLIVKEAGSKKCQNYPAKFLYWGRLFSPKINPIQLALSLKAA